MWEVNVAENDVDIWFVLVFCKGPTWGENNNIRTSKIPYLNVLNKELKKKKKDNIKIIVMSENNLIWFRHFWNSFIVTTDWSLNESVYNLEGS